MDTYKNLKDIASKKGIKFLYETNVCAGLPIISTINDMTKSGDKVYKLEAILSGTLNFIFDSYNQKMPVSKVVKVAKEMGYSEPDPPDRSFRYRCSQEDPDSMQRIGYRYGTR